MLALYSEIHLELGKALAGYLGHPAIQTSLARPSRKPGIRRDLLLRLVIGMGLTLASVIVPGIAASRTGTPSPATGITYYLLPGHAMPAAASCDSGDLGFRYLLYCTALQQGGGLVSFAYSARTKVIRSASLAVDGVTIGDLIRTWGTPNSYRRESGTIQIYWGEKSALASAPLNPVSPVRCILYYLDPSDQPQHRFAWRGFVTVDSPTEGSSTGE